MNVCDLSIASLNVQEINDYHKRRGLFRWIHRNNFDITLFQETYSELLLGNQWKKNNLIVKLYLAMRQSIPGV